MKLQYSFVLVCVDADFFPSPVHLLIDLFMEESTAVQCAHSPSLLASLPLSLPPSIECFNKEEGGKSTTKYN